MRGRVKLNTSQKMANLPMGSFVNARAIEHSHSSSIAFSVPRIAQVRMFNGEPNSETAFLFASVSVAQYSPGRRWCCNGGAYIAIQTACFVLGDFGAVQFS